jgi:hypothetical protein
MDTDPRRIIVTEGCCQACNVETIYVHHRDFPEMQIEGMTADQAAGRLMDRLVAALDNVSDASHREAVGTAIDDVRAFLDREGSVHLARELSATAAR